MRSRSRCDRVAWAAWGLVLCLSCGRARAQSAAPQAPTGGAWAPSYQLQASTYGQAQPGSALLILNAHGDVDPRISAEALVWGGYKYDAGAADVLVMAIRIRDLQGRAEARLGRLMIQSGALRPLHIDGAYASARGPGKLRLEAFAGVPVVAQFGNRSYDWVVGSRLSRTLGDYGEVGASYAFMRLNGQRADQEVAFDLGLHLMEGLDFNSKLSVDIFTPGVAQALADLVYRKGIYHAELFFSDRNPSRMLRSNSLFTVLGAYSSSRVGSTFGVRAAPRLDVQGTAAMRVLGHGLYESLLVQGTLRLDDEGKSSLRAVARREGAPGSSWTGLRGAARIRIAEQWSASTEVELVIPDHPHGQGKVWPWGRLGARWIPVDHWQIDLALQASANPQYRYVLDAMGRVTYRIGGP